MLFRQGITYMQDKVGIMKTLKIRYSLYIIACICIGMSLLTGCTKKSESRGISKTRSASVAQPGEKKADGKSIHYHALIVGISDYNPHSGNGWESLQTARNDAEAVADSLESTYGFNVTRLFDDQATRDNILVELDKLSDLSPEDAVLVYYAGHGYYDETLGEGYWIPSDALKSKKDRYAKEDWVWNSMITKVIGASPARHILVIADSCYGGSMFRGGDLVAQGKDLVWYQRALNKPSRYLITSGDLEPVLDSGSQHSIFAQELLNYLNYPTDSIFAASDLAMALRRKVSALTGQMVRMGPLAVATHGGGEFIFKKEGADLPALSAEPMRTAGIMRDAGNNASATEYSVMKDAVMLNAQGATNTAKSMVASLVGSSQEQKLVHAVAGYLSGQARADERDELRLLIEALEKRKQQNPNAGASVDRSGMPQVIACLGPTALVSDADMESLATLMRICLRTELEGVESVEIVEREALEDILQELNLGTSDLSDPNAQLQIGKVLPASLLLLGNVIDTKDGTQVFMRLIDTETTRIISSYSAVLNEDEDVGSVCSKLAEQVEQTTLAKAE